MFSYAGQAIYCNGTVTQIKQALACHNTTVKQVLIKVIFQSQIASLPLLATREAEPRPSTGLISCTPLARILMYYSIGSKP